MSAIVAKSERGRRAARFAGALAIVAHFPVALDGPVEDYLPNEAETS